MAKVLDDLNSRDLSKDSFTLAKDENPLITAVHWDKPKDILHAIDSLGCDINLQDKNGNTPLMSAIILGQQKAISLLIEKGADLHLENNSKRTAISLAQQIHDQENNELNRTILTLVNDAAQAQDEPAEPVLSGASSLDDVD